MTQDAPDRHHTPMASDAVEDAAFPAEFQTLLEEFARHTEAGRDDAALGAALKAFVMAAEQAEKNPTPDLQLGLKADELEHGGNWTEAERVRREILTLREQEPNQGLIAKAHFDLSRLFHLRGRLEEAWQEALAATAAARGFDLGILEAMMLENEAHLALARGEPDHALQAIEDALGRVEVKRLTALTRARLFASQARFLAAKEDWKGAKAALNRARRLMGNSSRSKCCPGPIQLEAACWEVEATLRQGRGDLKGAAKAWGLAVEKRRPRAEPTQSMGPYAKMLLAKALDGWANALADIGEEEQAATAAGEAEELRRAVELGARDEVAEDE